jgi:kynurenine 3-monooxygenase
MTDPRTQTMTSGRSINLALSVRGIESLKEAGVADGILETLIPMSGRMIHTGNNQLSSQPYGLYGECINSVDRKFMNEHLLSAAEALPNVRLFFEHAFVKANLDRKTVVFQKKDGTEITVHSDLIIGADGAYSKIRSVLMRSVRMDFAQTYIDHAYVELSIPPTLDDEYAMDPNHLHIWPRHTFMMSRIY